MDLVFMLSSHLLGSEYWKDNGVMHDRALRDQEGFPSLLQ